MSPLLILIFCILSLFICTLIVIDEFPVMARRALVFLAVISVAFVPLWLYILIFLNYASLFNYLRQTDDPEKSGSLATTPALEAQNRRAIRIMQGILALVWLAAWLVLVLPTINSGMALLAIDADIYSYDPNQIWRDISGHIYDTFYMVFAILFLLGYWAYQLLKKRHDQ